MYCWVGVCWHYLTPKSSLYNMKIFISILRSGIRFPWWILCGGSLRGKEGNQQGIQTEGAAGSLHWPWGRLKGCYLMNITVLQYVYTYNIYIYNKHIMICLLYFCIYNVQINTLNHNTAFETLGYQGWKTWMRFVFWFITVSHVSTSEDILSPLGFIRALWAVMNLRPGGCLVAGIKCSTWSIVNRSSPMMLACNTFFKTHPGFLVLNSNIGQFAYRFQINHAWPIPPTTISTHRPPPRRNFQAEPRESSWLQASWFSDSAMAGA